MLSLVAGVWAVDSHLVTKEIFELKISQIGYDRSMDNAYRDVQFWTQQEAQIKAILRVTPRNTQYYHDLMEQLRDAIAQKNEAIKYLNSLRRK